MVEREFTTIGKVAWMTENIRQSLSWIIENTSWLDTHSKIEAIKKVHNISHFISFSNIQLDIRAIEDFYSNMVVGPNYYMTLMGILQNRRSRTLSNILQIKENINDARNMVILNPEDISASFYQYYLHLAVSSGMLEFPFFNHGLVVSNYAAIGSQIGHEMGHAFDKIGTQFRWDGERRPWLSDESKSEYAKREKCFRDSYGKFFYQDIQKQVNGDSTLNENVADSIGFAVALRAYRMHIYYYGIEPRLVHLEKFTHEQLFTLTFANMWCKNASPRHIQQMIETDEHSPESARVNGIMMNSKEFAKIWNCIPGSVMNPKEKCEIFS